jgi:hypothetical protein
VVGLGNIERAIQDSLQYVRLRQANDIAIVIDFAVLWVARYGFVNQVRGMADSADEDECFGD